MSKYTTIFLHMPYEPLGDALAAFFRILLDFENWNPKRFVERKITLQVSGVDSELHWEEGNMIFKKFKKVGFFRIFLLYRYVSKGRGNFSFISQAMNPPQSSMKLVLIILRHHCKVDNWIWCHSKYQSKWNKAISSFLVSLERVGVACSCVFWQNIQYKLISLPKAAIHRNWTNQTSQIFQRLFSFSFSYVILILLVWFVQFQCIRS